ncbi:TRAP transporter large permease [Nitriliruptor alkaliphilus]|uniref:TRAP transporter large permease n=1 Tax=Nitriliruptor alkaliphilus TaxID=427918 RepID=UPI000696C4D3|nr:TRAP transporter large permease subunit [Nitriliruptor alkaliphilus]
MEPSLVIGLLLGVFLFFLFAGLPVAIAFIAANLLVLYLHSGPQLFTILSVGMFDSLSSFTLIAVPLFILMGEMIFRCGFIDFVSRFFESYFGRVPGRTGVLTIGAGTFLAAVSGAPIATGATLGSTLVPRMVDQGYAKWLAAGTGVGGAALATLIPPSALAIVLASLAEVSPARVLIGGALPGLLTAVTFVVFVLVIARVRPGVAPEAPLTQGQGWRDRARATAGLLPLATMLVVVLLAIFTGVATPTEASALGVGGVMLLGVLHRRLTRQILVSSFLATVASTGMIFLIIAGSRTYSQVLSLTGAGRAMLEAMLELPVAPIVIVGMMVLAVLVLGCFIDSISLLMIVIPLFVPVVISLGYEPLWFCIVVLIAIGISGITPPVGMVLYALHGVYPSVPMTTIYRGAVPFIALQGAVLLAALAVPAFVMWIPNMMQ